MQAQTFLMNGSSNQGVFLTGEWRKVIAGSIARVKPRTGHDTSGNKFQLQLN
jgi:hypothetical protein